MKLTTIIEVIIKKYPKIYLYIIEDKKYLILDAIIIPAEDRCKGIGSNVMKLICKYADLYKKDIVVLPALDYGATDIKRLEYFYSKFNFVKNKYLRDKKYRIAYMVRKFKEYQA